MAATDDVTADNPIQGEYKKNPQMSYQVISLAMMLVLPTQSKIWKTYRSDSHFAAEKYKINDHV